MSYTVTAEDASAVICKVNVTKQTPKTLNLEVSDFKVFTNYKFIKTLL